MWDRARTFRRGRLTPRSMRSTPPVTARGARRCIARSSPAATSDEPDRVSHAIAHARVARVVVAVQDPNPSVAGAGIAYLRSHGIVVEEGEGRDAASRQNAAFFTWITKRRPFITLKTAVSADGFVGRPDTPVKLTGHESDRWFHRQRAEVDAIAVGSTTVLVDDPMLTPRLVYRERPLTRVIFDRRGRVSPTARVFSTLAAGPVIMIVSERATRDRRERDRGPRASRRHDRDCRRRPGRDASAIGPPRDPLGARLRADPRCSRRSARPIWSTGAAGDDAAPMQVAAPGSEPRSGPEFRLRGSDAIAGPGGRVGPHYVLQLGADTLNELDVHRPD